MQLPVVSGVLEHGTVANVAGDKVSAIRVGKVIVKLDMSNFCPFDVETLLGGPSKAKQKFGPVPLVEMVQCVVSHDLDQATQHNQPRPRTLKCR